MHIGNRAALITAALFIGGCVTAPQKAIDLSQTSLTPNFGEIGVAMTELPKADLYLPGADCLLCIAVASGTNSSLSAHAKTLPPEDLSKLKEEVADVLRKKGMRVTVIQENLNIAALPDNGSKAPDSPAKDFSSLQQKYNVAKLLVIDIKALGILRTYASYIPSSDPKGYLEATGYLVNLKNNAYEWYMPLKIMRSADQNWDEPPKFPGLTNAYFQALETGRETFLKPLSAK